LAGWRKNTKDWPKNPNLIFAFGTAAAHSGHQSFFTTTLVSSWAEGRRGNHWELDLRRRSFTSRAFSIQSQDFPTKPACFVGAGGFLRLVAKIPESITLLKKY